MLRYSGACLSLLALTVLVFRPVGVPPAQADEVNFAVGLKAQYVTLTRTLKIDADQHRVDAPRSDPAWMRGVVFHAANGPFFFGADYATSSITDSEGPFTQSGVPLFVTDVPVDVSELNLALGYTLTSWFSAYIGYLHQEQKTGSGCLGCVAKVDLSSAGPGLIIHYPLASLRWAVSLKAAWIQGFSLEGALSYAGLRWPIVGVVGYAYQRIDYPGGNESSCSQPGFECQRVRDVFSGPTIAVEYVF
jgi:hypothetical protein